LPDSGRNDLQAEPSPLRPLLQRNLGPLRVEVTSRPWVCSPIDSDAESAMRRMRYQLLRDRGDLVFRLDPHDERYVTRHWDGGARRFLDGLVVRSADLRVSPLVRQRSGAPRGASFVPTCLLLDSGAILRFTRGGQLVARATYVVAPDGARLVEGAAGCQEA